MKERKITIRVDEVLYKNFKVKLAQNGHTAQSIIQRAIESYLQAKVASTGQNKPYKA